MDFDNFHFGMFGGFESNNFRRLSHWDGEVVLKGLVLDNFRKCSSKYSYTQETVMKCQATWQ